MKLKLLKAINFKNHRDLFLEFSEDFNGFSGPNGAGKTNVLDAIHYLCLTKSHFVSNDQEIVSHGETFFRLSGVFEDHQGLSYKVQIKVEPGKRKEVMLNGKKFDTLSQFIGKIPVLFQAPDDIYHLLESSTERRKWMDKTLSQQDHAYLNDLVSYNKLLKQRNAYLKSAAPHSIDRNLLSWYEEQMAPVAASISAGRNGFIKNINKYFQKYYGRISDGKEQVSLLHEATADEKEWLRIWSEDREKDIFAQRTGSGPHREDLTFFMNEKPLKRIGSQGQIKSYILSLILSQYKVTKDIHQKVAILLLDDIFARLDRNRVEALLTFLRDEAMGSVFVTDTDYERLEKVMSASDSGFSLFTVEGAQVKRT